MAVFAPEPLRDLLGIESHRSTDAKTRKLSARGHAVNVLIRAELQANGALSKDNHPMPVLTQRSELTSADRNWAALYQPADVLYYTRGSKELGLERGTYATLVSTDPKRTSSRSNGRTGSTSPTIPSGCMASPRCGRIATR